MNSEPIAAGTSEPTAQVTPEQALHLAIAWHRDGRWDAAEKLYAVLLQENPTNANALHFLGVLKHQRGDHEQALSLIQRSLTHDSSLPDWHSNLGNVLLESHRLEEAAAAYERARALAPDRPELHNNLGVLRREQGRLEEAEAAYRHAVALKPDFSEAHTNLAWLLHATGRADEAVNAGWEALLHSPQFAKARKVLGMAYARLGRMDEAVRVYREWLDEEPDNAQARHFLRACSGEAVPERAPDDYVEAEFDGFANSFDAKLAALHYRAPALIAQQVEDMLGVPSHSLAVLDAGCGTGLCGPLLAPYARHLQGVDLSAGMLEKARPRQVYDVLTKAELTAFIEAASSDTWDLIVSADTLCYFGRLSDVFKACRHALRPQGLLMFTVEALDANLHGDRAPEQGFVLNTHGRYSHDEGYLSRALQEAGLEQVALHSVHLRMESARPVLGWLVAARKAAVAV